MPRSPNMVMVYLKSCSNARTSFLKEGSACHSSPSRGEHDPASKQPERPVTTR